MKKILLIAPPYFNYYKHILNRLSSMGYKTFFIQETKNNVITSISRKLKVRNKLDKHNERKIIEVAKKHEFEYLIVIGGRNINNTLKELFVDKSIFKNSILYEWDSLLNFDYRNLIPIFDSVLTFDKTDSEKLGIKYLPLFYVKELVKIDKKSNKDNNIDLLFIGIWHSDRSKILKRLSIIAEKNNLKYYFKLYYDFIPFLYLKFIKKTTVNFYTCRKRKEKELSSLYKKTNCIVDIHHPLQNGLTMRTIETIANGKKLITTNKNVINEPFYNDSMIKIIERENLDEFVIEFDFLQNNGSYQHVEEYELSNWLNKLLRL